MDVPGEDSGWRQHFPTYHFQDRDIALEEYRFATKTLEGEERVFLNATNFSVVLGAALGSLALGSLEKLTDSFAAVVSEAVILAIIALLAAGFAVLSLRYLADRHKSVVFAARKVIVLRRMLGMRYGDLQLVLPNWRIEGADEPLVIRLFPGWHTYVSYPCYAIAGITSVVAFFVFVTLVESLAVVDAESTIDSVSLAVAGAASLFVILCWLYRLSLLDTHERVGLLLAQWIAHVMRLSLVKNVEYVIYRATLGTYELQRLNVDLSLAKKILVHIEDKEFFRHSGVSMRGLGRLALSVFGRRRRSGGSTITQQLVRTLFIVDQSKLVRRKLVEILLARWFNKVLTKDSQLAMYLASVRFDRHIYGFAAAMNYYFGRISKTPLASEAFFLIERVSNVRSRMLVEKIDQTMRGVIAVGLLSREEARETVELYAAAIAARKVQDPGDLGISRLRNAWA
ncbi:MAG: biosynthetic peptidoglycan transglycosylase [Steroidobacteraceae bacterium]